MTAPNLTNLVTDALLTARLTMEYEAELRENPAEAALRLALLAQTLASATPLQLTLAQTQAVRLLEFLDVPGAKKLVNAAFRVPDEEPEESAPTPPPDPAALLDTGRSILDAPDQPALVQDEL